MDYAATTPIHEEVLSVMHSMMKDIYGNPSSIHSHGRRARAFVDEARRSIAGLIGANEKEIIFTSGGTEADNLAIIGTAFRNRAKGNHVILSKQEHHAALNAAKFLEKEGFKVSYLPVDSYGRVSPHDVEKLLTDETILVSVMYVNNETGIIQPISEIADIVRPHQAYFHTDAVQAFGLLEIDVERDGIDLLTASSHKINGPKGVGLLYAKESVNLQALQYGGEQERKRRPGTENVPGIIGFQKAFEIAMQNRLKRYKTYEQLRDAFLQTLEREKVLFKINGDLNDTVPTIVNISFPGTYVEQLLTNLDLSGVSASSGSACMAGSVELSHVLQAMFGTEDERVQNSVRFSFGYGQTIEMMKEAGMRVSEIVKRLQGERGEKE